MISFEHQVVVITGAGGGLGSAYAKEIAGRGGAVVVNDLGGSVSGEGTSAEYANRVVADIEAAGGRALANTDDISSPTGAAAVIDAALSTFGRLDAVIANAGNMRFGEFESLTADDLDSLLAVHVGGAFHVAQAAWPHLREQGYGRLVFTTSSAGMLGVGKLSGYGAAKGGVMGLMHALSEEGREHGILCNAVMPNAMSRMTETIGRETFGDNPAAGKIFNTFDPRFTAGLAAWLASRECNTTHSIYSALGGRIGRVFVGVCDGWQGSREEPCCAEDVAANIEAICDPGRGYSIPANMPDEFRIVVDGK